VLIEGLVLSLVVGKIRGGKFKGLGQTPIRNVWLFILAFILEFATLFAASAGVSLVADYIMYLHTASYILLFAAIISNREHRSMWLVLLGSMLNFLVIFINGGAMPVAVEALNNKGLYDYAQMISTGGMVTHQPLTDLTKLPFLADIIILPAAYPLPKVHSIGDIIISLGIFLFVQKAMLQEKIMRQSRMIRFKYKGRI